MKKLLLITIAIFCNIGVYAQVNELNCTEQAVTFEISLQARARGYSPKIGKFEPALVLCGFGASNAYTEKQNLSETIFSFRYDKALSPASFYVADSSTLLKKMTFVYPKINLATGKFNRTTFDHFKLLPMPVINTLSSLLN